MHEARRAASGAVPALLARGRQSDMDGARGQARVILGVVRGACTGIVCDLMLLIEGCTPDELPERMIGGTRLRQGGVACVLAYWRAGVLACWRARAPGGSQGGVARSFASPPASCPDVCYL